MDIGGRVVDIRGRCVNSEGSSGIMPPVFGIGEDVEYHGRPKPHGGQLVRTVFRAVIAGF